MSLSLAGRENDNDIAIHVDKLTRRFVENMNGATTAQEITNIRATQVQTSAQNYAFQVFRNGLQGMVSIYNYDKLADLDEEQFGALVGAIFDEDPLLHALAMYVPVAAAVDFVGIYTDATYAGCEAEQAMRINLVLQIGGKMRQ